MYKKLLERSLIPGDYLNLVGEINDDIFTAEYIHYTIQDGKIKLSDSTEDDRFEYYLSKNKQVDSLSTKTIVYFHVNKGFSFYRIERINEMGQDIVVGFSFYGYKPNRKNRMIKTPTLDNLVEQSELIVNALEEKLRTTAFYGDSYKREDHLIFVGRSLGTIVATKLAAKMEKNGSRVSKVINIVSPLNMKIAIQTALESAGISSRLFEVGCVRNLTERFFDCAREIGILDSDIQDLQKTDAIFVYVEQDIFCKQDYLYDFLSQSKPNIKIYMIVKDGNNGFELIYKNSDHENESRLKIPDQRIPKRMLVPLVKNFCAHNSFDLQDKALFMLLNEPKLNTAAAIHEVRLPREPVLLDSCSS